MPRAGWGFERRRSEEGGVGIRGWRVVASPEGRAGMFPWTRLESWGQGGGSRLFGCKAGIAQERVGIPGWGDKSRGLGYSPWKKAVGPFGRPDWRPCGIGNVRCARLKTPQRSDSKSFGAVRTLGGGGSGSWGRAGVLGVERVGGGIRTR